MAHEINHEFEHMKREPGFRRMWIATAIIVIALLAVLLGFYLSGHLGGSASPVSAP